MKIAVTSVSGQLGAAIANQLKSDIGAENVIGTARTPENAKVADIEVRKADYNNKSDFLEALKGVDAVLLVSGFDHPDKRIEQHRNVIEAAAENGVKKIVYTSIVGADEGNAFSPIVASNRQTEQDIRNSGLEWAIGRNGIYIEPDLEYLETYQKESGISNCAGDGACGYTSRAELAFAYSNLLTQESLNSNTYNLLGPPITQAQLADALNERFGTNLVYKPVSTEQYLKERQEALGEYLGTIIGGIYEGIRTGEFEVESHFKLITGRPHKGVGEMIGDYKAQELS